MYGCLFLRATAAETCISIVAAQELDSRGMSGSSLDPDSGSIPVLERSSLSPQYQGRPAIELDAPLQRKLPVRGERGIGL
jgi:hypothetical protein